MNDKSHTANSSINLALRGLSNKDFMDFGLDHIAYIRFLEGDEEGQYAIHSADGEALFKSPTLEQAIIETRLYDLEPVIAH